MNASSAGRVVDILLVEDDAGDELITREAFADNKIKNTLHVARDGQEGLDFLYRRGIHADAPTPDLILLDLNLPKYDGRQLLEAMSPADAMGFLSGLLISADVAAARDWFGPLPAVTVIGDGPLATLYAQAVNAAGAAASVVDGEAAVLAGLSMITRLQDATT